MHENLKAKPSKETIKIFILERQTKMKEKCIKGRTSVFGYVGIEGDGRRSCNMQEDSDIFRNIYFPELFHTKYQWKLYQNDK